MDSSHLLIASSSSSSDASGSTSLSPTSPSLSPLSPTTLKTTEDEEILTRNDNPLNVHVVQLQSLLESSFSQDDLKKIEYKPETDVVTNEISTLPASTIANDPTEGTFTTTFTKVDEPLSSTNPDSATTTIVPDITTGVSLTTTSTSTLGTLSGGGVCECDCPSLKNKDDQDSYPDYSENDIEGSGSGLSLHNSFLSEQFESSGSGSGDSEEFSTSTNHEILTYTSTPSYNTNPDLDWLKGESVALLEGNNDSGVGIGVGKTEDDEEMDLAEENYIPVFPGVEKPSKGSHHYNDRNKSNCTICQSAGSLKFNGFIVNSNSSAGVIVAGILLESSNPIKCICVAVQCTQAISASLYVLLVIDVFIITCKYTHVL